MYRGCNYGVDKNTSKKKLKNCKKLAEEQRRKGIVNNNIVEETKKINYGTFLFFGVIILGLIVNIILYSFGFLDILGEGEDIFFFAQTKGMIIITVVINLLTISISIIFSVFNNLKEREKSIKEGKPLSFSFVDHIYMPLIVNFGLPLTLNIFTLFGGLWLMFWWLIELTKDMKQSNKNKNIEKEIYVKSE